MNAFYTKFFILSILFCCGTFSMVHAKRNELPASGFTLEGAELSQWSENFDKGMDGWEIKSMNEERFHWKWRNDLTGNKSFKGIDPDDRASLFIEGVYAARQGEQDERLISPAVRIPENATLKFYGGYGLGSFSVMSIKLKISADAGESWTEIWDAETGSTGGNAFAFRLVKIDLEVYKNKSVKLMWEYKARATMENSASDFVLDGIAIVTPGELNSKQITAGESVRFYNTSAGDPTSLLWTFEGGTPAASTENNPVVYYYRSGSYSVSLKVSNPEGTDTKTVENAVIVDAIPPVARIGAPTQLKARESRNYFVPYREEVQFQDRSENFPDHWSWAFTGGDVITSKSDEKPVVFYDQAGNYKAALTSRNSKGEDSDEIDLEAGFSSFVWNMNKDETVTDYFQTDRNEYFPGNNTRIEAYAEYFDKPAAPALLDSLVIRFVGYQLGEDILHQIGSIQVKIHKAENGQPGEMIAWTFYDNIDINYDQGAPSGISFGNDLPCIIDFPFFVVVEDLPMSNADGLKLVMGMASWRNDGNTAYLKKKGEDRFIPADSYFGKDKQTSYWIAPRLKYMILHPEKKELSFEKDQSEQTVGIYARFEWSAESDQEWCKVMSTVVGETGSVTIACDRNKASETRQANILLTNGGITKIIRVTQEKGDGTGLENATKSSNRAFMDKNGNLNIEYTENVNSFSLYTIDGKKILEDRLPDGDSNRTYPTNHLPKGVYIINFEHQPAIRSFKIIK